MSNSLYKVKVLIDARSTAQLSYMLSTVKNLDECILIWCGEYGALNTFKKLNGIPKNTFIINNINEKYIWIEYLKVMRLKTRLRKIQNEFPYINKIFSSYNYGIYFELLKKIFHLKNINVILFDDGFSSMIKIKNKYRLFKSLIYFLNGIFTYVSKHRLYYDDKCLLIKSVFFKENQIKDKSIENISVNVYNYYRNVFKNNAKRISFYENSALLLTHPAVELNRITSDEYHNLIYRIVSLVKSLKIENIYLSKHRKETFINEEFYNNLGLIPLAIDGIPAEVFTYSKRIKVIAQPYNSLIPICTSIGTINKEKIIISYSIAKSPYLSIRQKTINKILLEKKIKHFIV